MPPGDVSIRVEGLRDLQAALARADRATRLGVRAELRRVADPVQRSAESLARTNIRNIGPRWSRMRIGVTRNLVYVAPRQKGVRVRGPHPLRRPNLASLLMDRAMEPALHRNEDQIGRRFEDMLDRVADNFNHGGTL